VTSQRAAVIATVREQLAVARSAARTTLAGAEAAHWRAQAALDAARLRLAADEPRLAVERANRIAAAQTRYAGRRAELAAALAMVAPAAAPGAAGEPWAGWAPTPGTPPGLYRIGMLCGYDVPALVPLLGRAHLTVHGGSARSVDGLIAGLLLRVLGSTPPGTVRIDVYDPDGLAPALAGLVRHLDAGDVSRPEPWRVAVLLAPPGGVALAELARTRGVHVIAKDLSVPGAITVHFGQTVTTSLTGTLPVALDPVPPPELIHRAMSHGR